jgi:hypothetical protein
MLFGSSYNLKNNVGTLRSKTQLLESYFHVWNN